MAASTRASRTRAVDARRPHVRGRDGNLPIIRRPWRSERLRMAVRGGGAEGAPRLRDAGASGRPHSGQRPPGVALEVVAARDAQTARRRDAPRRIMARTRSGHGGTLSEPVLRDDRDVPRGTAVGACDPLPPWATRKPSRPLRLTYASTALVFWDLCRPRAPRWNLTDVPNSRPKFESSDEQNKLPLGRRIA